MPDLTLDVLHKKSLIFSDALTKPVEIGRLKDNETSDQLCVSQRTADRVRVAIVGDNEVSISRQHVLVQPIAEDRIRVTNISNGNTIQCENGTARAGESRELSVPASFFIGPIEIRVKQPSDLQSLTGEFVMPGALKELPQASIANTLLGLTDKQAEPVVAWLESVVTVLQSAVSSSDFYQQATKAMVKLVGLDSGRILMRRGGNWVQEADETASHVDEQGNVRGPSTQILATLLRDRRTVWGNPRYSGFGIRDSLSHVQVAVAAPIVNRHGDVIGALYGDRAIRVSDVTAQSITRGEAMLVKALATSVAVGLARLEQEQAVREQEHSATAARALFGQFFTPELSEKLALDPNMLNGRDAEVTLLFCDIRGFSRISQRLEPTVTLEWLRDAMGVFSDCVIDQQGVLVDYIGDELLAMWGAPSDQPDQAVLACRAAVAISEALPSLNARWQDRLGVPFQVGIGINTGTARVGNTGSHRKLKYGPHGSAVNVASRVRGMTRHLGQTVLITGATQAALTSDFATRRLCKARVVNISEPLDLYELKADADDAWHTLRREYEEALDEFERQNFTKAADILGSLVAQYRNDPPALLLLTRAVALLNSGVAVGPAWDSSWTAPGK